MSIWLFMRMSAIRRARVGAQALEPPPPLLEHAVFAAGRREQRQALAGAPVAVDVIEQFLQILFGRNPVGEAGEGAIKDQGAALLGMAGGEECRQRAAFGDPEDRGLV
jgi:hypothetical protein